VSAPDDGPLEHWDQAATFGLVAAVTTRFGGVSSGPYDSLNLGLHVDDDADLVRENRRRATTAFGVELEQTVFAQQVHGTGTSLVTPEHCGRGALDQADALRATDIVVTTSPDPVLVILVADCVPLLLVDPAAKVLALVHAGWRGTAAGAVGAAVRAMAALGARPERTAAFLGPAIAPTRYQVGPEVQAGLRDAVTPAPLDPEVAEADGPDHFRVDLIAANRQQLQRAGLPDDRVFDSATTSDDGRHFSDRTARPCGRFGLMARLLP
jgi:YfiH family protein